MLIASINPALRRVYLDASTAGTSVHPIDVYKEMRTLRKNDESLRQYDLFMEASGNIPKGPGKATERFVILLDGTRIVPFDVTHQLTITGTIITDDGQEGIAAFDRTSLTPGVVVDINYVPPQVEVITVSTGLAAEDSQKISEISQTLDLQADAPNTYTEVNGRLTRIQSTGKDIVVTDNGDGTRTAQRQP